MNAKTPEAAPKSGARKAAKPDMRVSNEVLKAYGDEYELAPQMSREAYATFLKNLEQDYGYVLESETLLRQTGVAAAKLKEAVAGQGDIRKAEKELSAKIDKAVDAMGEERGQKFTIEERLAAKILVTKAMTAPTRSEGAAPKGTARGGDMERARMQAKRTPGEEAAPAEDMGYANVNPDDEVAAPLPPGRQPPMRGPKPTR